MLLTIPLGPLDGRVSADPTLTVGLSLPPIHAKVQSGEWPDVLRWSQWVIEPAITFGLVSEQ
jgi:hypothetical protein